MAYTDIDKVMGNQSELVELVGKFIPRIVRMDKSKK
jgi:tRNA-splicing ligase RtcB